MKTKSAATLRKMGATNKRAKKVRTEAEFPLVRLSPEVRAPIRGLGDFSWDADLIRAARDSQLRGFFSSPVRLAASMNSDAGLFTSRLNRLAPMRGLPVELRGASEKTRAVRIRDEGEALFGLEGIALQRDDMVTLHRQYVDHGVSIGYNTWTVREDGSRVDVMLRAWPLEFVRWMPQDRSFYTQTQHGQLMRIEHGDGRWVVFQQEKLDPWASGCVVPGGMIWADRAFGIRDRSTASRSHAMSKFIGELPEGVPLEAPDANGVLQPTNEAQAMLDLLQTCHVGDLPVGVRPFGSKTDLIVNSSQAWQIWNAIIATNDADASRVYLGQDGTTTNSGGNYIKSERLFGVRNDLVEADIGVFSGCLKTGVIEPWCAINFGDSRDAPTRLWLMPDADEDARRTSIGEHMANFIRDITALRDAGFAVDQDVVNGLAADYGVKKFLLKSAAAPSARPLGVAPSPGNGSPPTASLPAPVEDAAE